MYSHPSSHKRIMNEHMDAFCCKGFLKWSDRLLKIAKNRFHWFLHIHTQYGVWTRKSCIVHAPILCQYIHTFVYHYQSQYLFVCVLKTRLKVYSYIYVLNTYGNNNWESEWLLSVNGFKSDSLRDDDHMRRVCTFCVVFDFCWFGTEIIQTTKTGW